MIARLHGMRPCCMHIMALGCTHTQPLLAAAAPSRRSCAWRRPTSGRCRRSWRGCSHATCLQQTLWGRRVTAPADLRTCFQWRSAGRYFDHVRCRSSMRKHQGRCMTMQCEWRAASLAFGCRRSLAARSMCHVLPPALHCPMTHQYMHAMHRAQVTCRDNLTLSTPNCMCTKSVGRPAGCTTGEESSKRGAGAGAARATAARTGCGARCGGT